MKRVLLMNQFFPPDLAPTGQLLGDLARHLAEQGHHVRVICARGAYAAEHSGEVPAVEIVRVRTIPFSRGFLGRLLSYASYMFGAIWHAFRFPKPDIIVTLTTPPLLSIAGTMIRKLRGAAHFIWIMDLYPDVAVGLGVLRKGSWPVRVIGALADYSRRQADGVIVLGECMKDRLVAHGIEKEKISVAENWADGQQAPPVVHTSRAGRLKVLYAGNLGMAHDVETLLGAMKRLKGDTHIRFLFVGGGLSRRSLEEACHRAGLGNVDFLPYCSRQELNRIFQEADLGVVTQKRSCLGCLVPSKIYALLAAGLPVVFIGPRLSAPAKLIERFHCGWQISCGDTDNLLALLDYLWENPHELKATGQRARGTFLRHYDRPLGVRRISRLLGLATATERSPAPMLKTQCTHS